MDRLKVWIGELLAKHEGMVMESFYFTGSLVAIFFVLFLLKKLALKVVRRVQMAESLYNQVRRSLEQISPWTILLVSIYIASRRLGLGKEPDFYIKALVSVGFTFQILVIASDWIRFGFDEGFIPLGTSHLKTIRASLISIAILIVWVIGILLLLDNLGFNVATILAGLGVGGLAVGLAMQSVFKDVIACFSIGFDKPFEVGDFVIVGNLKGTIELVGLKTTRIRSLGGELLVFPNSNLVESNIQNFGRMNDRRVVFSFGVTYSTPQDQLKEIPGILKSLVEAHPITRFDRAHFQNFGDSALNFEMVYFVLSPNYNDYMDIQQSINLGLKEELEKRGVGFAFPTRTLELDLGGLKEKVLPNSLEPSL